MGQFLDHDTTLTPEAEIALERCCDIEQVKSSEELRDKCFAVLVPDNDPFFSAGSANQQVR